MRPTGAAAHQKCSTFIEDGFRVIVLKVSNQLLLQKMDVTPFLNSRAGAVHQQSPGFTVNPTVQIKLHVNTAGVFTETSNMSPTRTKRRERDPRCEHFHVHINSVFSPN